ncbi:MAG: indolepyruvate oxidoreductase subunit beta [Bacillota bacterium]|nr:indolepyruvate oxidoreductase subunit beta [Bacillota bacterium]
MSTVLQPENTDIRSCLLCGVGGQGTVLASRLIANAAMRRGLSARTAETIGMAQRGGSVVSHVRIGSRIASPMIPEGQADVLLGFEPGEAAANLRYLKEGGTLIVCRQEITPVTAALGLSGYRGQDCLDWLRDRSRRCIVLDSEAICRNCGSPKVLNTAFVGALCASGAMGITSEDARQALRARMKPTLLEMNLRALELGAAAARGLISPQS